MAQLFADDPEAGPPFPFWNNFEVRPLGFRREWPPTEPLEPVWREWIRFVPTSTFDDPWVDAGRALVCIDVQSWPAASRPHMWKQPNVIAPSMDLYVAFHDAAPDDPWLLARRPFDVGRRRPHELDGQPLVVGPIAGGVGYGPAALPPAAGAALNRAYGYYS